MSERKFFVSPDGSTGVWIHALDLTTGHYPKYADWIDASDLGDDEFEALVRRLQSFKFE